MQVGGGSRPLSLKRGRSLPDSVAEHIRRCIVAGGLKPGDALPTEIELARQLGVGRSSVREAVKALEALGVVTMRPGIGPFVGDFSLDPSFDSLAYGTGLDLEELRHALDIRRVLEIGLADRTVDAATPEQIRQLGGVLRHWRRAVERGEYNLDDDGSLHGLLYVQIGNPLFARTVEAFWAAYCPALALVPLTNRDELVADLARHERIVAALVARDAEALRQALLAHYAVTEARIAAAAGLVSP